MKLIRGASQIYQTYFIQLGHYDVTIKRCNVVKEAKLQAELNNASYELVFLIHNSLLFWIVAVY